MTHTPVFLKEALQYLNLQPGQNYIDATADGGGHAVAILKAIQPGGKIMAIEWDEELFKHLADRFKKECTPFSKNYVLENASYAEIANLVRSSKFGPVAGALFDLGMSSFHIEDSKRGFSFRKNEALDMRFSRKLPKTAADILADCGENELEKILKDFGEERFSRRIAKKITAARGRRPVKSTFELVELIRRSTPSWYHRGRLHFAARTFQALRIAVNRELENIPKGLEAASAALKPGGRIVVITFHSLEDRAVKNFFRSEDARLIFTPIIKKPLRPSFAEISSNPRAGSAKLRVFEKIS